MTDDDRNKPLPDDLRSFGEKLKKRNDYDDLGSRWAGKFRRRESSALGIAFRVTVEVVSALAVGLGIGWALDNWLGTRPWLMILFLVLGGAAGILNVYRLAAGFGYAAGYEKHEESVEGADEKQGGRDDRNQGT